MKSWILIEAGHPSTTKDVPVTSIITRGFILAHEGKNLSERRAKLMYQLTQGELNLRLQALEREAQRERDRCWYASLRSILIDAIGRVSE